jgi:hypothetical protein
MEVEMVSRLPGNPESLELPLAARDQPFLFGAELIAGNRSQPAHLGIVVDFVHAQPFSQLVEIHVTGLHEGSVQGHQTVALFTPATKRVLAEREFSVAESLFARVKPSSSPAIAITILNVDPGAYCPATALF